MCRDIGDGGTEVQSEKPAHLVTKATHTGAFRLLHDFQAIQFLGSAAYHKGMDSKKENQEFLGEGEGRRESHDGMSTGSR